MTAVEIVPMKELHWNSVREIYGQGIATGNATFERRVPDWPDWDGRHLATCRLVAMSDGEVLGWAALSRASSRQVYRGVAEVSLYIAEIVRGKGIGSALLRALISDSEKNNIWTLQAGIFPENIASIRLHERAGFRTVGRRERLGCMDGHWRDVVLMERRSKSAGT